MEILAPARDLRADGAEAAARGVPVVLLFSLPECSYCLVVRRNYLLPLQRDLAPARRPVVRELQLDDTAALRGFDGAPTSAKELAARYHARFAPTVVLVDDSGALLAAPIVGGDTTGLYGGYLDNALAEAVRRLASRAGGKAKGERQ
jgi:hypothetical protein